jgi:HAD superfamily hydrolase (TIGR01509 family)
MPTIKNLIWDIDGTVFDTYPAIALAFQQAMSSFGHAVEVEEMSALAQVSVNYCVSELIARYGIDQETLEERFNAAYIALPKTAQVPFDGVRDVLEWVRAQGGVNGVVTHRLREGTHELLRLHSLDHLFDEIVAGDDGFPRKPAPDGFLAVVQRCGLDPAETAAVGDRELDILAGKGAGLTTCWFRAAPGAQADFVFNDYAELLAYLKNS